MKVKILNIKKETNAIKTFVFEKRFDFIAGQFVMLEAFINGELVKRAYSIASAPQDEFLDISIELVNNGKFSTYMHKTAKIGDIFEMSEPKGRFILGEEKKIVMIAGGSGVVPFRSMIREEINKQSNKEIILFLSSKTKAELLYHEELSKIEKNSANIRIIFTLTRENPDKWDGNTGRITIEMMLENINDASDYIFYLCGSNDFVIAFSDLLKPLGVKVKKELWG